MALPNANAATPEAERGRLRGLLVELMQVAAGSALLVLSAKVQVPFWPVPATLQTLAVLLLAFGLGGRLAALSVIVYLAEGAIGLPVFAGSPERGLGLAYMMGPTGGYLAGFLAAALAVGHLADRGAGRRTGTTVAALAAGLALIYLPGTLWLGLHIGAVPALRLGGLVFLPAEAVKLALATALLRATPLGRARTRGGPQAPG